MSQAEIINFLMKIYVNIPSDDPLRQEIKDFVFRLRGWDKEEL
jgi:hypothetical protein